MRRNLLYIFFLICLFMGFKASAQHAPKDSTPIEDLDYRLSESEFMQYYGTDDTARALIHMFYRKRGHIGIAYCLSPGLGSCLGSIMIDGGSIGLLIGSGAAATSFGIIAAGAVIIVAGVVYPIIITVNRIEYTRQRLLNCLVNRERGGNLYQAYLDDLRPVDFDAQP